MALEVANPGDVAAPYACGLHPGFRWPLGEAGRDGASGAVRARRAQRSSGIAPGGMIRTTTKPVPLKGRDLPLSDALFANDAVCFLDCRSRSLAFVDASGASIAMEFPDYSHAALWTRPGAPYVCLECWTGYSDPEGFDGDLFRKAVDARARTGRARPPRSALRLFCQGALAERAGGVNDPALQGGGHLGNCND